MSSRRESFVHRARNLLPYAAIFDFPIPFCQDCKGRMVKLEGRWGCKVCSKITKLMPVTTTVEDGKPVTHVMPVDLTLAEVYPNRAARRAIR